MRDNSDTEWIDSLVDKLSALFGSGADGNTLADDMRHNMRALIQSAVSKLDIVSREEFDAQVAVLQRSRDKIEALEQQLAELNEQLNNDSDNT